MKKLNYRNAQAIRQDGGDPSIAVLKIDAANSWIWWMLAGIEKLPDDMMLMLGLVECLGE